LMSDLYTQLWNILRDGVTLVVEGLPEAHLRPDSHF
jgi:hypothetical protein